MPFNRSQPYNNLPLLAPAVELETKAVLKDTIKTNRVLANLRGLAAQIPNQGFMQVDLNPNQDGYARAAFKLPGENPHG